MVNDVLLVKRRLSLVEQLRTLTAAQLARLWDSLDSYTDDREWQRLATPVLLAGQNRAVDLGIAHLQARLGERLTFDRAALLSAAGIDITQPFIALANALDTGLKFEDAVAAGRARAEGVGESGVTWASRATGTAADDNERVVGWTRVLSPGSCDWCITVSTQRYRTAESASFGHLRCFCEPEPIIETRDPGRVLNKAETANE